MIIKIKSYLVKQIIFAIDVSNFKQIIMKTVNFDYKFIHASDNFNRFIQKGNLIFIDIVDLIFLNYT